MNYRIKASSLHGMITIPPSKSHTMRAILFGALASGKSIINNYLSSPDTQAMINACRLLGAQIEMTANQLTIIGTAGQPKIPDDIIDAGNSGQVLRFIGAVAALTNGYVYITGDQSIRSNRPIQPLLDGLKELSVFAVSTKENGYAPIIIKGPLCSGTTHLNGEDSQPVSGLLIASAFAKGPVRIQVSNPGEQPWIDLTLDWFKRLGITYTNKNYMDYTVTGNSKYSGFEYTVPGDFSSAAFPIVAALITHSEISLNNLDMNDVQGDKALISVLQDMGAEFEIDHTKRILTIKKSPRFCGKKIDVNHFIDAVPILTVMSCFAKDETYLTGAAIARTKESDRLAVMTQELKKMGASIQELQDGLIIQPAQLHGAHVFTHDDHRVAMSLAVAALAASGVTTIEKITCINKSYPDFAASFQHLGAALEVC